MDTDDEWEMINVAADDEFSISPPKHHKCIQIQPPSPPPPPSPNPKPCSSSGSCDDNVERHQTLVSELSQTRSTEPGNGKKDVVCEILASGFRRMVNRMSSYCCVAFGGGFWPPVKSVTMVVAVVMVLSKLRRWLRWIYEESIKNKSLMLLIQEKDKRIKQLLSEVAEMRAMLASPRKVPVVRVAAA